MNITTVTYSKVFSLGNYENEKIGVEVSIGENEDAQQALTEAKNFVEFSSNKFKEEMERARDIVEHPDNFTTRQVRLAQELVKQFDERIIGSLQQHVKTSSQK
jgi:hypothetical protein